MGVIKGSYRELRRHGLVAHNSVGIRKPVSIAFEGPCKLGSNDLAITSELKIGAYSFIRCGIVRSVQSIGRYCSIGPNVILGEAEHPTGRLSTSVAFYPAKTKFDFYPEGADPTPKTKLGAEFSSTDRQRRLDRR